MRKTINLVQVRCDGCGEDNEFKGEMDALAEGWRIFKLPTTEDGMVNFDYDYCPVCYAGLHAGVLERRAKANPEKPFKRSKVYQHLAMSPNPCPYCPQKEDHTHVIEIKDRPQ